MDLKKSSDWSPKLIFNEIVGIIKGVSRMDQKNQEQYVHEGEQNVSECAYIIF